MSIVGGGVYGYLEAKAKADPEFLMNKIPRPIEALGYAGGTALALYLINRYAFKNKYVEALANGTATVAMYHMGKAGETFKGTPTIQGLNTYGVSGDDDDISGELDDATMGALEEEGSFVGDSDDDDDELSGDDDDIAGDEELAVAGLDDE
jgi:hypothetical protein